MSSSAVSLNFCFCRLVIMLKAIESISSGVMRGTSVSAFSRPSTRSVGMVADLQVQVGGPVFDGAAQKIVNVDGHERIPRRDASCKPSMRLQESQGRQAAEFLGWQCGGVAEVDDLRGGAFVRMVSRCVQ